MQLNGELFLPFGIKKDLQQFNFIQNNNENSQLQEEKEQDFDYESINYQLFSRSSKENSCEEEFYIDEKVVYWSEGNHLSKVFSMSSQVLQVCWSNYLINDKKTPHISILHRDGLFLYSIDGKITEVVFPMSNSLYVALINRFIIRKTNLK